MKSGQLATERFHMSSSSKISIDAGSSAEFILEKSNFHGNRVKVTIIKREYLPTGETTTWSSSAGETNTHEEKSWTETDRFEFELSPGAVSDLSRALKFYGG